MNKRFVTAFSFFVILLMSVGCNSSTQNSQVQDIVELKWQSDGNALFGFIQSYVSNPNIAAPTTGYDIAKFNSDGSVAQIFTNPYKSRFDFSYSLFVSNDGNLVVTQLENDLYRLNIKTGVLQKLDSLVHLIVASPDLHYVAVSPSPANQTIKTIDVYDITVAPIRRVSRNPYVYGLSSSSGIWLNNGTFSVTCLDSLGSHVSIYDTAGTALNVIGGAQTAFHNVVFNSDSNSLFVRNLAAGKSIPYSVDKINLTTFARTTVLNLAVDNFDVTKDANYILYSVSDTIKIRNITSQKENLLTTDILRFISLSPVSDKLAYITGDVNFNQIRILSFIRP